MVKTFYMKLNTTQKADLITMHKVYLKYFWIIYDVVIDIVRMVFVISSHLQ